MNFKKSALKEPVPGTVYPYQPEGGWFRKTMNGILGVIVYVPVVVVLWVSSKFGGKPLE